MADLRRYQEPTVYQGFGGRWNLKNENRFDAIGEQLNLFEGQKTCGQRHGSPSRRARSGNRIQDTAGSESQAHGKLTVSRLWSTTP